LLKCLIFVDSVNKATLTNNLSPNL